MAARDRSREPFRQTQLNDVHRAITEAGLSPREFARRAWIPDGAGMPPSLLLTHKATGYRFIFYIQDLGYVVEFTPAKDAPSRSTKAMRWRTAVDGLENWLAILRKEIDAPDLWALSDQENALAETAAQDQPDEPFAADEKEKLTDALREIKEYLGKMQDLQAEHAKLVESRFEYLSEAVNRMGKRDWLHTSIGVFFTVASGIALNGDRSGELFSFIGGLFRGIFGKFLPAP